MNRGHSPSIPWRASLSLLGVALCLTGGSMVATARAQEEESHEHEIHVAPEILEEFGVAFAVAGAHRLEESITLAGEIRPDADRLAQIAPRYEGVVTSVKAEIGDEVKAGQVLCTVEGDQSLSEYELPTLIAGTVIAKDLTLGESVDRERVLFSVADLSTVWLDLSVYQRDLSSLREGQAVDVFIEHDEHAAQGKISYISPVLDQSTRTGVARVVLRNPDRRWRLGMFVTARVTIAGVEVPVAVERDAVFDLEGEPVVFARSADGELEVRDVLTGREGRDWVEIVEGLSAGESYVNRGGFALKAELGKDRFGDGHAH